MIQLYPQYFVGLRGRVKRYIDMDRQATVNLSKEFLKQIRGKSIVISADRVSLPDGHGDLSEDAAKAIQQAFQSSGSAHWIQDHEPCFWRLLDDIQRSNRRRAINVQSVLNLK